MSDTRTNEELLRAWAQSPNARANLRQRIEAMDAPFVSEDPMLRKGELLALLDELDRLASLGATAPEPDGFIIRRKTDRTFVGIPVSKGGRFGGLYADEEIVPFFLAAPPAVVAPQDGGLRAQIEALPRFSPAGYPHFGMESSMDGGLLNRSAVLALLSGPRPTEERNNVV